MAARIEAWAAAIAADREELRDIAARHYCGAARTPSHTLLDALAGLHGIANESLSGRALLAIVRREVGL